MSSEALTEIAELKTFFTGDLSDLQAKSEQARKIVSETAQQMTAALSQAGGSFGASMSAQAQQAAVGVQQLQGNLGGLKAALASAKAEADSFQKELLDTRSQMAEMAQKIADATAKFGSNSAQVKTLKEDYRQLSAAARGLSADKAQLANDAKKAGDALKQEAAAMKEAEAAAKRAQTETTNLGSSIRSMSTGLVMGGTALAAVGAAFGVLIKSGSDLQQELVHVAGNTSMSAAEFANLQQSVIRLGLSTPVAMDQIGKSYMQAANFGFHFADANLVVEASLKSAVATGADAEQTTRALAVAMHTFQIPAAQAAQTMDILHLAAARGGQTLEQFTAVTGRVFSIAHAMGISLVDASAALSSLTSAGLSAAQAATLLQGAIVKIANPSKQAAEEVARLSKATGIDLVHDFSQAGLASKGLSGVLEDISKAVGGNTAEILKLVPAMRGGIGVIMLTTTAAQDYKDRLVELNDVMAGKLKPTQQDFDRVMGTLGAQASILANSFQALGLELVNSLGPGLASGLQTLNGILPEVVLFIGKLPPVIIAAVAAFFAAVGAVGAVSVALGGLVFLLGGPVALAVAGLGLAVGALAATVALNFNRITAIGSTSSQALRLNFIEIAMYIGAVVDIFQVFARSAIMAFDIVVSGALLMAQGVKQAFYSIKDAGAAAIALANNDIAGFAVAVGSLAATTVDSGKAIQGALKGLLGRVAGDMKDIASHASGEFTKSFALAAANAGQEFKKASATQHQSMEEAGLKLVNAYIQGVVKGKPISAETWHSMSEDARASFSKTAQDWAGSNARMIEGMDDVAGAAKKKGKQIKDETEKIMKAQLDLVNDWLKAIDSKVQISEDVWKKLLSPDTKAALERASAVFHAIQDVIQKGQAEALAASVTAMAGHKQVIDVAIGDWSAWGDKIRAVAERAGVDIKIIAQNFRDIKEPVNQSAKDVEQWSDTWVDSLGKTFQVAQRLVPSLTPALDALRESVKRLKEDIASSPLFQEMKMKDEAAKAYEGVIQIVTREGERLGLTQDQINTRILTEMAKMRGTLPPEMLAIFDLVVANAKRSMDRLPGALDEIFNKMAVGAEHQVAGLFQVIDSIPGKFGDALRKSTSEITKWIDQIDGLLKGLHKIFASIPDGLAGVLGEIESFFKGISSAAQGAKNSTSDLERAQQAEIDATIGVTDSLHELAKSSEEDGKGINRAFGIALAGITAFITGLQTANATGSKAIGALAGGITGALSGLKYGPWGAVIGGVAGVIGGLLGGGKTQLQKAQEAAALQKAKDDIKLSQQAVEQAFEATKQSVLATADKARQLLEAIIFYTRVPKDAFKAFFEDLDKLMKAFAEHAKNWMVDASDKIKVFAEDMKVMSEAIALAPTALTAIAKYLGVSESSITKFFADFGRVLVAFGNLADDFTRKFLRSVRKFGEQLTAPAEILSNITTGIKDMFDLRPIPEGAFDDWQASLKQIVVRLADLAQFFDKFVVKQIEFFAEKVAPGVDLWKSSVEAIRSMVDAPVPSENDFRNLFDSIKRALSLMTELASTLDTEALNRAQAIAEASMSIFAAIKAAVEALGALRDYKQIAGETFAALAKDFELALILMNNMIEQSAKFIALSVTFEENMKTGAAHLSSAVEIFRAAIKNLGFALGSFGVNITMPPDTGAQSVGATTMSASSTYAPMSATSVVPTGGLTIQLGGVAVSIGSGGISVEEWTKISALLTLYPELAGVLGQYD